MTDKTTTPEPQKINYRSDFVAVLELADAAGKPIPFPDCDFEAVFWTGNANRKYAISRRGDVLTNCRREPGGGIRAIFDHHGMGVGELKWEPQFRLPNGEFPDGYQDVMRPMPLNIILVSGPGDLPSAASIAITLPYIKGERGESGATGPQGPQGEPGQKGDKGDKGDSGKPFTYGDFTPEQLEGLRGPQGNSLTYDDLTPGQIAELQRPATEAAQLVSSVIDAATATNNAITKSEQTRVEAEQSRAATEQTRVEAEQTRVEAESLRVKAEQTRVEAEQERAREFAGFAQEVNKGTLRLLDLQWEQAGGSVIVSGETYGLNGINDLSLSEAIDILAQYANATIVRPSMACTFQKSTLRTTFPIRTSPSFNCDIRAMFSGSTKLETLVMSGGIAYIKPMPNAFQGCSSLRKIDGNLYVRDCSTVSDFTYAFKGCAALEDVRISKLKVGISFADSPLLSIGSISYLIAQSVNTNTLTITLHPDAYARVTDDIFAAAAAKNITIATP